MAMPKRWIDEAERRKGPRDELNRIKTGEVLGHKQVHCSGGCGYYCTKMEYSRGEDGFVIKNGSGKWCAKCAGKLAEHEEE